VVTLYVLMAGEIEERAARTARDILIVASERMTGPPREPDREQF
jgi:hypothetical protein